MIFYLNSFALFDSILEVERKNLKDSFYSQFIEIGQALIQY
jgi:hypothetical protein